MSIKVMNWLWENSPESGHRLLCLLALADFADDSGSNAYPSVDTLRKKSRTSESGLHKIIKHLKDNNRLHVDYNKGRNGTNIYTVLMDDVAVSTKHVMPSTEDWVRPEPLPTIDPEPVDIVATLTEQYGWFYTRQTIADMVEEALAHKAASKYKGEKGQYLFCRNWVRRNIPAYAWKDKDNKEQIKRQWSQADHTRQDVLYADYLKRREAALAEIEAVKSKTNVPRR